MRTVERRTIVAMIAIVIASPIAARAQKLTEQAIQLKVSMVVNDTQKIRNVERDGINAFIASLKASTCVKSNPQWPVAMGALGGTLMNIRTRADQNLPNELGRLFRNNFTFKPGPPIPGKQGSLTGEAGSKINEYYLREANDTNKAIGGGLSTIRCPETTQVQTKLNTLRTLAQDSLQNMMRTALQNANK